ncbi:hypothetical protein B9Z19DRAFT_1107666 [Tuber borchii]|uniref:Uncharacterized protein n=1 Tax=Tuber borchii TaxID=42251 RepID=A0A2T6ZVL8_TUBBO|nr:hypothetical protein B9Z19DRAFT_1107666 [Tuber borchii]
MALTPQYNPCTLPSGQHIPISVANNQAQVSGRLGINPGQAVSPVIAQSGNKSSVPAPVTSEKRQSEKSGSNSSSSKPVTKKARLMMPPETQAGSSHAGARGWVNPGLGNNSVNAGSSSSAPMERNTGYPRHGYFPVNLGPGSQQHQPVGRASASPKPSSTPTGPQNRVQLPQAAPTRSLPDPAVLEKNLKILRELVAKEDAILKKFEDYQQVYGPSLYAFYMGDKTSNPRPELRMMVTEQDEADMQTQGQALLQVTKAISSTILQIIMNMTHEQSEPHYNSLMYFCKSAGLRNAVPVVERVMNTRLMASLILGE